MRRKQTYVEDLHHFILLEAGVSPGHLGGRGSHIGERDELRALGNDVGALVQRIDGQGAEQHPRAETGLQAALQAVQTGRAAGIKSKTGTVCIPQSAQYQTCNAALNCPFLQSDV